MKAHDIIRTVIHQHAALRELLADIRVLAERVLDGATHLESELSAQLIALMGHIHHHLHFEETRWVPLMRGAGIWNEKREAAHRSEHAAVRAALSALQAHERTLGPAFARAAVELADAFDAQTDIEDGETLRLMGKRA